MSFFYFILFFKSIDPFDVKSLVAESDNPLPIVNLYEALTICPSN